MPLLIVTSSDTSLSQRLLVREERFAIGRLRTCAVPIPDRSVSKSHVLVFRTPAGWSFQDLFSRNGTFLNEERRDSGTLRSGDVLRLGKINITFLDEDRERTPGAEAPPGGAASVPSRGPLAGTPSLARGRAVPRSEGRRKWIPAVVGIGAAGLILGLLAGRMTLTPRPERPAAMGTAEAPGAGAAGVEAAEASSPEAEVQEVDPGREAPEMAVEAAEPLEEARIEEIAAELKDGPSRPYADREESQRVLFRLSLDVLGRPPTRAESREVLPLGHADRWRRIGELAGSGRARATVAEEFQRFLGRTPTPLEERALEELAPAPGPRPVDGAEPGGEAIEPGLLITASKEYRSAEFRRKRSPDQRARSLIVDLLDRPPAGEEEVLDVEKALGGLPAGKVARVLVWSPGGLRALAANPPADRAREGSGDGLRDWTRDEIRRFLLRPPGEAETEKALEEVRKTDEGARRLRIALASLAEYRSY